ncbi:MAG: NADH-quinone oxidoreductase subunit J [Paludibacteraceae bacterium]|nr:NADH-quinone oxidoreductase subunit J [Candidatus Physcocola equi]MCQ2234831.1 NADH-quinone oxidoreductase subunit J [Paludibacteraceae bacterium]
MDTLSALLTGNNILFAILTVVVLCSALLSVLTEKLMHAAFYLFLTLVGIAAMYMQMQYEFLAGAQLSVYAGGILMLFIFAIVLVHHIGENSESVSPKKKWIAAIASISGVILCLITMYGTNFNVNPEADELVKNVNMETLGYALLGTGKNQYLLPFEATGILLLACIIGAVVIANKEKEDKA